MIFEAVTPPWEKRRRVLVRLEAETNPDYGEDPYRRSIERLLRLGVINLDKPRGPTSHELSARIKALFEARRAGHGGTLDPAVSGVLPILIDDATCAGVRSMSASSGFMEMSRMRSSSRP